MNDLKLIASMHAIYQDRSFDEAFFGYYKHAGMLDTETFIKPRFHPHPIKIKRKNEKN